MALAASLTGLAAISMLLIYGSRPAQAACSALPSGNGTVTFTVDAPTATTYRFWMHMYSPSSGNNAVYLQVDNTYCNITVGNSSSIAVGQFTWVDYQSGATSNKINMTLAAGNHTVKLAGLDVGVGVDKIMFASDTSCVPTGDGSNCVGPAATPTPTPSSGPTSTPTPTVILTPPPASTPAPEGSTPVSGTVTLPQSSTGTTRTYYLDNKPVDNGKLDTTKLSDGIHVLKIVETDKTGKVTTKSQKLFVNNKKNWASRVLDWLKNPLVLAGFVFLLLAGAGAWLYWRVKQGGPRPPSAPTVSVDPANPAPAVTPTGIPPANIVYPDNAAPKP